MANMVLDRQINFRVSKALYKRISMAAQLAGISPGEYVRKCVELGDVMNANKERIAEIHLALKKAITETLERELPIDRKKTA